MNWLFKEEPTHYSFDDLVRDGKTSWSGVKNPLAQNVKVTPIGQRTGVAQIFGMNFSGFIAWWLWRTIYLSKLPRFEKKCRVALDWTLDLLFSKDLVQFTTAHKAELSSREFAPDMLELKS